MIAVAGSLTLEQLTKKLLHSPPAQKAPKVSKQEAKKQAFVAEVLKSRAMLIDLTNPAWRNGLSMGDMVSALEPLVAEGYGEWSKFQVSTHLVPFIHCI